MRRVGASVLSRAQWLRKLGSQSRCLSDVTEADVRAFESILGSEHVVRSGPELDAANRDWLGRWHGAAPLLLRPSSTAEVSSLLRHCNDRRIGVVTRSGNTGLVGGSVTTSSQEVVLSMARMDRVLSLDTHAAVVQCQSGCTLQSLDDFLEPHGLMMPIDLGVKASCMIGGNIATNAGGLHYLRYGSMVANVMGVEVVRANGTVLDLMSSCRKDATGFPLRSLFVGSEGTLGVITGASVACVPRPVSHSVMFLAAEGWGQVLGTLAAARRDLGGLLSAFEFIDRACVEVAERHIEGYADPLAQQGTFPFYVVVEASGSDAQHDAARVESFLALAVERGLVAAGIVSQTLHQARELWRLRSKVPEALPRAGRVYKYDLSLPLNDMYGLVEEVRRRIGGGGYVTGFGHLGDQNLHLNAVVPEYSEEVLSILEPFVYEWTLARRGSISAEHGLGQHKREDLHYSKTPEAIELMASIKALLDPNDILNPRKTLPQAYLDRAYGRTPARH